MYIPWLATSDDGIWGFFEITFLNVQRMDNTFAKRRKKYRNRILYDVLR